VARALTVRLRPSKGRKPSFCAARRRCFGGGAGLRACGSRPGLREVCGCAFGGGGVRARAQGLGLVGSGGLDADLVADWHRLQALKQATKLAHPIPEDGTA
jgi:hypothetical protein